MQIETVKAIKGYEGLYAITDEGQVLGCAKTVADKRGRLRHIPPRFLKTYKYKSGYIYCVLCKNGKAKKYKIHRLVAQSFLPSPVCTQNQVNHINGHKDDNRVCNLEWCNASENCKHAFKIGLKKAHSYAYNTVQKPVQQLKDGLVIAEYSGCRQAGRETDIHWTTIARACRKENGTARGFGWRFK